MRRWIGLAVLAIGCSGGDDPAVGEAGAAAVCFGADTAVDFPSGEAASWTITGELIALGAGSGGEVVPCNDSVVDHSLAILDADGVTWTVGYGLRDADGATVGPPLDVASGAQVTLLLRAERSFGDTAGFVLSDDAGVIVAAEMGTWGDALQQGDVPGLTVAPGEQVATEAGDCGTIAYTRLVFTGDSAVEATPVADDTLELGGVPMTAWAIASWDWEEPVECTDVAGVHAWAVFR